MRRDIVVAGASAGGVEALKQFVLQLPPRFSAALFIVLHIPPQGESLLREILGKLSPLPVMVPRDGEPFQRGAIYVPVPDHHLAIERDAVRVYKGPMQHRHRPSVDVLFRTAAEAFGSRVIGVVMTGMLDDGTAGLTAIKRHGGLSVVQDPEDAQFPDMPRSALRRMRVDYCVPLAQIPRLLTRLTRDGVTGNGPVQVWQRAVRAHEWSRGEMSDENRGKREGEMMSEGLATVLDDKARPSAFSCPDCHGVLWEVPDRGLPQFTCRVGHGYSLDSLGAEQDVAVEDALWAAVRALSEQASLARQMAEAWRTRNSAQIARQLDEKAERCQSHAAQIRELLTRDD